MIRQERPKAWTSKFPHLGLAAQVLIGLSMGLFFFGQFAVFAPVYSNHLRVTISGWYGASMQQRGAKTFMAGGHSELARPTFFMLFCVLPMLVIALMMEFLRNFSIRRVTSRAVLTFARIMRRKPRAFNCVSYFSYGELLFLTFLFCGNLLIFYYAGIRSAKSRGKRQHLNFEGYLHMYGNALGYNALYNFVLLFIPVTRNSAWMEFLNVSYANAVRYHRWVGVAAVLTGVLHCAAYYTLWIRAGEWVKEALPCFHCDVGDYRGGAGIWLNVFGELALLCFVVMGLTSIPWVRRKMYNLFYYVHQLFLLAIVFTIMHIGSTIWWLLPTVVLYVMSRVISHVNSFKPVEVKELTCLDHGIVKVVIARSTDRDGDFKVGQFVYLKVPSISKLQWHAFTIASSPRGDASTLTILLKSLGDWTKELVEYGDYCKSHNLQPVMYMDGYYGTSLEMYDEYSTVCLIGGGIGSTPMFAILEDIVAKLSHSEPLKQRVVFLFSFRELSLLEEVHPILTKLKELDPTGEYFRMEFYLTRVPGDEFLAHPLESNRVQARANFLSAPGATFSNRGQPKKAIGCPFAEPLRFKFSKSVAYVAVLALACLLVVLMEYGDGKIVKRGDALWPLQQCVEASLMMLSGVVVYLIISAERFFKRRIAAAASDDKKTEFYSVENDRFTVDSKTSVSPDVVTYSDLLAQYGVVIGHRPDMEAVMVRVYEEHKAFLATSPNVNANPSVGVFVSGPEAMKWGMVHAVAKLGSQHFDIHEEEFEL